MSRDDECWGCGDTSPDCACTKERAVSEWAEAQRLGYKQGAAEGYARALADVRVALDQLEEQA